jgi:hypothetical protein
VCTASPKVVGDRVGDLRYGLARHRNAPQPTSCPMAYANFHRLTAAWPGERDGLLRGAFAASITEAPALAIVVEPMAGWDAGSRVSPSRTARSIFYEYSRLRILNHFVGGA